MYLVKSSDETAVVRGELVRIKDIKPKRQVRVQRMGGPDGNIRMARVIILPEE